ncbi:MAG: hypothetical protein KC636_05345 [Myxococcales bacterium]|nr:hypothetical protein [Myxococcales bacterium]
MRDKGHKLVGMTVLAASCALAGACGSEAGATESTGDATSATTSSSSSATGASEASTGGEASTGSGASETSPGTESGASATESNDTGSETEGATTGGVRCSHPGYHCAEYGIDCDAWACGDPFSIIDADGCPRPRCGPGCAQCFTPADWGQLASSYIECQDDARTMTCHCVQDDELLGSHCIDPDEWPITPGPPGPARIADVCGPAPVLFTFGLQGPGGCDAVAGVPSLTIALEEVLFEPGVRFPVGAGATYRPDADSELQSVGGTIESYSNWDDELISGAYHLIFPGALHLEGEFIELERCPLELPCG